MNQATQTHGTQGSMMMRIIQTHGTQAKNFVEATVENDNFSHEPAVEQGLITTGKTQTPKDVLQSRIIADLTILG